MVRKIYHFIYTYQLDIFEVSNYITNLYMDIPIQIVKEEALW